MIWKAKSGDGSVFKSISAKNKIFWTSDSRIIFPYEGDGWTKLYSVSTNGGKESLLTPGKFEVQFASISTDGKSIYFSSNQNDIDRQHIWVSSSVSTKPRQITKGSGVEWSPIANNNGDLFIIASDYNSPAHPYLVKGNGQLISLAPKSIPKLFPKKFLIKPWTLGKKALILRGNNFLQAILSLMHSQG